jgi:hypothetical protein
MVLDIQISDAARCAVHVARYRRVDRADPAGATKEE